MKTSKNYTLVIGVCVGVAIIGAGVDIITSQGIVSKKNDDFRSRRPADPEFILNPGFGRQVKIVTTSEPRDESPETFNLKCIYNDINGRAKIYNNDNNFDIYFNRNEQYIIKVEKDFNTSINITIKATKKGADPVIIIKTLSNNISICQDVQSEEVEKLDANEKIVKTIGLNPLPRGTYYMWIGDFKNITDTYTIVVSEY